MKKQFYIEQTNKNGTYQIVCTHDDYENCINFLQNSDSNLKQSLWCDSWVNTKAGFAPMAWIN